MESAQEKLLATLNKLGTTASEVAHALHSSEIRGFRNSCWSCPIAEYLKSCRYSSVSVAIEDCSAITPDHISTYVVTPTAIKDFMLAFDSGLYSHLVLGLRF